MGIDCSGIRASVGRKTAPVGRRVKDESAHLFCVLPPLPVDLKTCGEEEAQLQPAGDATEEHGDEAGQEMRPGLDFIPIHFLLSSLQLKNVGCLFYMYIVFCLIFLL